MKITLVLFSLFLYVGAFAQINSSDSTVQVIGFWNKQEKQIYSVSLETSKADVGDTTSRDKIMYDVEVTIVDSTTDAYVIEWFYKNFRVETQNQIMRDVMAMSEDVKVLIRTNEFGAILEVVNWEEVKTYMNVTGQKLLRQHNGSPEIVAIVNQVEQMYSTKAGIESLAIQDAQQFYTFHGAKYKLGEVNEAQLKVPNIYGSEPFDSNVLVYLDEVNFSDGNYILRAEQRIDSQQLKEATLKYLADLSHRNGTSAPTLDEKLELTNETFTASRVHETGWVIYSIQTKTVTFGDSKNIEQRIIEIK